MTNNETQNTNVLYKNLLNDKPATEDYFSGGGHNRTAKALAHSIKELANEDGAIGLEGEWGSGKSSVISIAQKELHAQKDTKIRFHFFEFDLWAHQTDNFKRSFLIEFLLWLKQKNLISTGKFNAFDDTIRNRTKVTTEKNTKIFTKAAFAFFLAFILTPLAFSVFRWQLSQIEKTNGNFNCWYFFPALAILLLPILIVLFSLVYYKSKSSKNIISDVLSISKGQAETETTTQFIRDEDPTSTEFRKVFDELLEAASIHTTGGRENRIVVVLDNIDRLPKNIVPDIWAELRTFFAYTIKEVPDANNAVTLILPYDKNHIIDCLTKSPDASKRERGNSNKASKTDILNKTFNITYRVSPPILSDTKQYFCHNFSNVFGKLISKEYGAQVYQLFHHWMDVDHRIESPRLIKSFINELSTIWNLWLDDKIPILVMALFIIKRNEIEETPDKLKQANYIDGFTERQLSNIDWSRNMAALYFNVDPKLADQVLLGDEIRRGLLSNSSEVLRNISQNPGFVSVFHNVINELSGNITNNSIQEFSNVFLRLKELKLADEWVRDIAMRAFVLRAKKWQVGDSFDNITGTVDGLFYPISYFGKRDINLATKYAAFVSAFLIKYISPDESSTHKRELGEEWAGTYDKFIGVCSEHLPAESCQKLRKVDIGSPHAEVSFGLSHGCVSCDNITATDFKNGFSVIDLDKIFTAHLKKDTQYLLDFVLEFGGAISSKDNMAFRSILAQEFNTQTNFESNNFVVLLKAYLSLHSQDASGNILATWCDNGTALHHYKNAPELQNDQVRSLLRWLLTQHYKETIFSLPAYNAHPVFGDIAVSRTYFDECTKTSILQSEVKEYAKLINKHSEILETANLAVKSNLGASFYHDAFIDAVKQPTFNEISIEDIGVSYAAYRKILGAKLCHNWLKYLEEWSEEFEDDLSGKKVLSLPSVFFEDIEHISPSEFDKVFEYSVGYFADLSQEEWKECLLTEDETIRVVLKLQELDRKVAVKPASFRQPLHDVALEIYASSFSPTKYAEHWNRLPMLMPKASRNSWAKNLLKAIGEKSTSNTPNLINFFDKHTSSDFKFPFSKVPLVSMQKIIIPLLQNPDADVEEFFKENEAELKLAFDAVEQDTKQEIIETIDLEKGFHKKVAQSFKIKIKSKKNASPEE